MGLLNRRCPTVSTPFDEDPDLVWYDAAAPEPSTHALLIGVGHYPAIGTGHELAGLNHLSSPPVAARELASFFIGQLAPPGRPLKSVALLLSESTPLPFAHDGPRQAGLRPGGTTPRPADVDAVEQAAARWVSRASAHPDSQTIFYFAGHGFDEGLSPMLLLRDYAANAARPLKGSIDLAGLQTGLATRPPSRQLFLIDACRTPSGVFTREARGGSSLLDPLLEGRKGIAQALMSYDIFSTQPGTSSYGKPNKASVFSQALQRALRGPGARNRKGAWLVTTLSLHDTLEELLARVRREDGSPLQRPQAMRNKTFELHALAGDPVVPIFVATKPRGALAAEHVRIQRAGVDAERLAVDLETQQEYCCGLKPNTYTVRLKLGDGRTCDPAEEERQITPPLQEFEFTVR